MKITKFDASRVAVQKDGKYAGLILIRKSSGLDLGWEDYTADDVSPKGLTRRSYGQIRIALTDGTYLDGMAMYVDDDYFEDGIDIIAGLLKSKPKLKRYIEKDGEIIFDMAAEPVGEGNPINIVRLDPIFTKETILARMREKEREREREREESAKAILNSHFGYGVVRNCKNCDHYNDTLSMSDSPCYNCDRRMGDYWTPKKG